MDGATAYLVCDRGDSASQLPQTHPDRALLQHVFLSYPRLLDGRDSADWLLIAQDVPVPGHPGMEGRCGLDYFFLDDHAVPTLVEVERSSEPAVYREALGTLLDCAANGVQYWPAGALREALELRLEGPHAAEAALTDLASGMQPEEFWTRAQDNLRAGRVRLVIVAERIPTELQRILEFLNEGMSETDILAVEVQHYQGAGHHALITRTMGKTAVALPVKGGKARPDCQHAATPRPEPPPTTSPSADAALGRQPHRHRHRGPNDAQPPEQATDGPGTPQPESRRKTTGRHALIGIPPPRPERGSSLKSHATLLDIPTHH